jgi:hypothetical protein
MDTMNGELLAQMQTRFTPSGTVFHNAKQTKRVTSRVHASSSRTASEARQAPQLGTYRTFMIVQPARAMASGRPR